MDGGIRPDNPWKQQASSIKHFEVGKAYLGCQILKIDPRICSFGTVGGNTRSPVGSSSLSLRGFDYGWEIGCLGWGYSADGWGESGLRSFIGDGRIMGLTRIKLL